MSDDQRSISGELKAALRVATSSQMDSCASSALTLITGCANSKKYLPDMGRAPFIGVHVYDFDTKNPGRPDKPSPWVVRWRVGGATKLGSRSFKHLGDAKRFHRQLENAADDGERFDSETLLPVSMLAAAATTSIADIAFRFYQPWDECTSS